MTETKTKCPGCDKYSLEGFSADRGDCWWCWKRALQADKDARGEPTYHRVSSPMSPLRRRDPAHPSPGRKRVVPSADSEPIPCCPGGNVVTLVSGPVRWACGVTTVPERGDLLTRTLDSLVKVGGFDRPQVFAEKGLRAFGTWWAAAMELYVRDPHADRYAVFQDDVICVGNLRWYLDRVPHPERGYWNLYTTLDNDRVIRGQRPGWYEAAYLASTGPNKDMQVGKGALGLVFPRSALVELLLSRHFVERPMGRGRDPRADRSIDGAVVTAMNKAGYKEYVHAPSLLQHTGDVSTLSSEVEAFVGGRGVPRKPRRAKSFPGEEFDALDWLKK